MKFWKIVSNLIEETLPDWRDNFLSYKDLKKQLKLIYPKEGETGKPNKRPRLCLATDGGDGLKEPAGDGGREGPSEETEVTKEVIDFVKLLEEEIEKFNSFFVDKEEEYIIRLKVLQDRVAEAKNSSEELMRVGRELVDFHGEMVLLENYSALNYTGLVKILKKYDKRSGALIRLPFIQKVLQEPFFKTDVLNKLVKESETLLDPLFSMNERAASAVAAEGKETCDTETATEDGEKLCKGPEEVAETEKMESMYVKTVSALRVLKEIRSRSSTVSMFSLPPMHSNEMEEVWKNSPVLEQTAK